MDYSITEGYAVPIVSESLAKYEIAIIVNEDLKVKLERSGLSGPTFKLVT